MALVLRRRRDGSVRVVGDLPAEHVLASSFIARGLAEGYVRVSVALLTDDGELTKGIAK